MEQTTAPTRTSSSSSTSSAAATSGASAASSLRGKTLDEQDAALDPNAQPGFDAQSAALAPAPAGAAPAPTETPSEDVLSAKQLYKAKSSYTRGAAQWPPERIRMVGQAIGVGEVTTIDDAFVQAVARWQKAEGIGVDGVLGPDGLKHMFGDMATDDAHARASAVTKKFESGDLGYAAYQNLDKGIVSYGVHQCTLASGSLAKVIDAYLANAAKKDPQSANAKGLSGYKSKYGSSSLEVKETLRGDGTFKQLLVDAAAEPEMVSAQETVFENEYWKPAVGIAVSCGLTTSLGLAAVYDCTIQSGPGGAKAIADKAIAALGGIVGSTGKDGPIDEKKFIIGFNAAREARLDAIIADQKATGDAASLKNAEMLEQSKARGRMFTSLAEQGNMGLAGDADGNLALPNKNGTVKVPAGDGASAIVPVESGAALESKPVGGAEKGAAASTPVTATKEQSWSEWGWEKAGQAWDWVTGAGADTSAEAGAGAGAGAQTGAGATTGAAAQTGAGAADATKEAVKNATSEKPADTTSGSASDAPMSTTPQISGSTASGYQGVGVFSVMVDQPFRDKAGKAKSGTVKAGQKVQVINGSAANYYAQVVSVSGEPKIVEADQVWVQLKFLAVDNDTAKNPGAGKTGAGVQLPAALQAKLPEGRNPGTSAAKMTFKAGVSFFDEDCAIAPDTMGRVMRVVQWAIAEDMVNGDIVISDAARSRKRAHTYATAHNIQMNKYPETMANILARAKASKGADNVADKDGNQWWLGSFGIDPNVDEAGAKAKIVERSKQIRTQTKPAIEGYRSSEFADRRWPNPAGEDISKHCSGKAVDLDIPWKIAGGGTDLWAWEEILQFFGLARTVSNESWHVEPKGAGQVGVDPGKVGE